MEKVSIKSSVGENAKNNISDVTLVQSLINKLIEANKLMPLDLLKVDGIAGKKTKHAIRELQRRIIGMSAPDGRIDPNGRTFKGLTGFLEVKQKSLSFPSKPLFNSIQKSPLEIFLGFSMNGMAKVNLSHLVDPAFPAGNAMDLRNLTKQEFVKKIYEVTKIEQKTSLVPAAITTAQAILETGFGRAIPKIVANIAITCLELREWARRGLFRFIHMNFLMVKSKKSLINSRHIIILLNPLQDVLHF